MYCNIYATTVSCWLYTDDKIRINIYEIQRLIDSVIHNQPQTISPSHFSRERKKSLQFFSESVGWRETIFGGGCARNHKIILVPPPPHQLLLLCVFLPHCQREGGGGTRSCGNRFRKLVLYCKNKLDLVCFFYTVWHNGTSRPSEPPPQLWGELSTWWPK